MTSNEISSKKSVVLRRRSMNYPAKGKRIHGIVFDHPSMPKIMAVSSVPSPENCPTSPQPPSPHQHPKTSPPALIHSPTCHTGMSALAPACTSNDTPPYYTQALNEPPQLTRHSSVYHNIPSHHHGSSPPIGYGPGKSTITFPLPQSMPGEYHPQGKSTGYSTAMHHPGTYGSPGVNYQEHYHMQQHSASNKPTRTMSYPSSERDLHYDYAIGSPVSKAKRPMCYPIEQHGHYEDAMGYHEPAAKRTMSYPSVHFDHHHFIPTSSINEPCIDLNNPQQTINFNQPVSPIGNTTSSLRHPTNVVPARFYPQQQVTSQAHSIPRLLSSNVNEVMKWQFHTNRHPIRKPTSPTSPVLPLYMVSRSPRLSPPARDAPGDIAPRHATTRFRLAQTLNTRRRSTDRHVNEHDAQRPPEALNVISSQPEGLGEYHYERSHSSERDVGTPPALVKPTLVRSASCSEVPRPSVERSKRRRTYDSEMFYKELLVETGDKSVTSYDVRRDNLKYSSEATCEDIKRYNEKPIKGVKRREVCVISDSDDEIDSSSSVVCDDDASDVFIVGAECQTERSEVIYQLDRDVSMGLRRPSDRHRTHYLQRERDGSEIDTEFSKGGQCLDEDVKRDFCSISTEESLNGEHSFHEPFIARPAELAKEYFANSTNNPPRLLREGEGRDDHTFISKCVRFCDDENHNINVDEHQIVRILNTAVINVKSEAGIHRNCEESPTGYERDPCRTDGRLALSPSRHAHVHENVAVQVPKKEHTEVSKNDLRTDSLSPTFGLSCPTHQLTDDVASTVIKKEARTACCVSATGSSGRADATAHTRETDQSACESCKDTTYAIKLIKDKLMKRVDECRSLSHEKIHCPSCDCLGTVGKRGDTTPITKPGNKPTGIVVGIKKQRQASEPLNTAGVGVKDSKVEGKTNCSGNDRVFGGFEETDGKLGKGFGLLQFNVIEKVAGFGWGDNCAESRDKGITSQQWEAFSVKLEPGMKMTQCDHMTSDRSANVCARPKLEIDATNRAAFQNWREGYDVGLTQSNICDGNTGKCCEDVPSPSQLKFSNIELNADKIEESLAIQQENSNDVSRKRSNSYYENVVRMENFDNGRKTFLSGTSKRQRLVSEIILSNLRSDVVTETGNEGKLIGSNELTAQLGDLRIAHKVEEKKVTESCVEAISTKVAAPAVACTNSITEKLNKEMLRLNEENNKSYIKKKALEVAKPEKKESLTSKEWKEILVGRIDQVRESIEIEETPWKTKNKRKVLEKLEQQLKDWEYHCSPNDSAAFLARKLQFFQTVRHQYELMKRIDAQRNTGKKIVNGPPENERPKAKVLKEHILKENLTKKKNMASQTKEILTKKKNLNRPKEKPTKKNLNRPKEKPTKKNVSFPDSAKKGRLTNKKNGKQDVPN